MGISGFIGGIGCLVSRALEFRFVSGHRLSAVPFEEDNLVIRSAEGLVAKRSTNKKRFFLVSLRPSVALACGSEEWEGPQVLFGTTGVNALISPV